MDHIAWPPTLRAELDVTPTLRRPWYLTIGPAYLTLFIGAPFFDPLWRHDIADGGLLRLAGSAVLAALACFVLFYLPTALWGYRTGRRVGVVSASTFGTTGSEWLTGPLLAIAEILWFAVAIDYAVQSTLLGLIVGGMVPSGVLANWPVGPALLRGPIVLAAAVFWIFITGMAGLLRLSGVIAALMKIYAPVAFVLLTVAALWVLPGVSSYASGEAFGGRTIPPYPPHLSAIPIFTGYFAMVGLMSVEWGAAARRRRDVVVGGFLGIVVAGSWTAIMSMLVVAGAVGRLHSARPVDAATAATSPVLSFRWAMANGVGGAPAALILILFGLATLAPAVYTSFLFTRKLFARWPGIPRINCGWIGGTAAFALIVTGWPGRLEAVDHMMGLVFAPAVGAMAGDFIAHRGGWAGVRIGWNPPGAIAWGIGVAARLILDQMAARGLLPIPALLASPIAGFLAASLAYAIMARLGLERPTVPVETLPSGSGEVAAVGDPLAVSAGQTA